MEPVLLRKNSNMDTGVHEGSVSCTHLSLDGVLPFDLRTVLRYQDLNLDLRMVRKFSRL